MANGYFTLVVGGKRSFSLRAKESRAQERRTGTAADRMGLHRIWRLALALRGVAGSRLCSAGECNSPANCLPLRRTTPTLRSGQAAPSQRAIVPLRACCTNPQLTESVILSRAKNPVIRRHETLRFAQGDSSGVCATGSLPAQCEEILHGHVQRITTGSRRLGCSGAERRMVCEAESNCQAEDSRPAMETVRGAEGVWRQMSKVLRSGMPG